MAASGFAGLGYQIVWTQQIGLWLGHETAAVLAVVAAFFGGLALGALLLGARIEASARPLRWYAACEAVIGAWGLVLIVAMPAVGRGALTLLGAEAGPLRHGLLGGALSFVLLLPATLAMGATLPALTRLRAEQIAPLYAANTLGAVAGVLLPALWLIPAWGLSASAGLCVALNLGCALLAGLVLRSDAPAPTRATHPNPPAARRALALLALTGLLGLGDELLVVRLLSQVTEGTVYTFALLLAVYLAGSALGAAAHARWRERLGDTDRLLLALAGCGLLGALALWAAPTLQRLLLAALPAGMGGALLAEALLAALTLGPAALLMGALFCQLSREALAAGAGYSRALGVNLLGGLAAAPLFGALLLPLLGSKLALLTLLAGYGLLVRRWRQPAWGALVAMLAALALWAPPLAVIERSADSQLLSYREGALATVSVVADADGVARLRINNRQQEGSSATLPADGRQGLLPLLLHGAPRQALFLGLGAGLSAGAAAQLPGVQVDAVELLPEVVQVAALFRPVLGEGPAPRVITADARRYVRNAERHYDVIVSDNFHPARSGSGALYTVEHFQAVRARLAPGGLFCQWLPLHQLDLDSVRSIVASFRVAFPDAAALLASNSLDTPVLGLLGRDPSTRFAPHPLPALAAAFGLGDDYALLGSLIAGPAALQAFAAQAPLNTDDHPWVAYHAPALTYAPDSRPAERLLTLLGELPYDPAPLLATPDEALQSRLSAYAQARRGYLALGRHVQPSADPAVMLARVGTPLLDVLRQSPDFRPAREPLERLAAALAPRDPAGAARLRATLDALR